MIQDHGMHPASPAPHLGSMLAAVLAALLAAALASTAAPGPVSAQTLKVATLAPNGTVWSQIFEEQTAEWQQRSQGRVDVRLYPGGVAGDDPDLIRKMRIGQLHGASLTIKGLTEIDDAFQLFTIPLFFQSPDELFFVLDELTPVLRQRLEAKGFVLLNWGYAGWAHLYSRRPIRSREDLQSQKLFMWGGDDRSIRIWRAHGLNPIGIPATDVTMAIQTGMIEALATAPLIALTFQWFRQAGHQLDEPLAPLMGATVLTNRAWASVSERDRPAVLAASERAAGRYVREVPVQDGRAIAAMRERGLTVTTITPSDRATWNTWASRLADDYRGATVPPDIYDLAVRAREQYRARVAASR
jgi:TRAP-type transport system periplasmic protein